MSESDPLGLVGRTIDELRFDECVDTEGSGLVYRGRLHGREDPVAIKCLSLSRLGGADDATRAAIASRFREESTILRRLSQGTHDIVHCFASGLIKAPTTGETLPYQVLEWLDGRTLRKDLAERRSRGMPGRTLRETLDLVESAALAIAIAHAEGIVHRDIEPANLMMTRTRGGGLRLKVMDFGLAKSVGSDAVLGQDVTAADRAKLFSADYCAPEQLSSQAGEVGPWTDVWALALVMFEVLRGEPIPNAQTTGSFRASQLGLQLPEAIEELLARATSLNPRERPQDAKVFWTSLRELHQKTAKPVVDASALAATAVDGEVAAAVERIRQMTAKAPTGKAPQSDKGTMMMAGAPPTPNTPNPSPAAGIPAQAAPAVGQPTSDPAPNPLPGSEPKPLVVTKPIAVPSPLASSLGGNTTSPVKNIQHQGTMPMPMVSPLHNNPTAAAAAATAQAKAPSVPPPQPVAIAVPSSPKDSRSTKLVVLILVAVIVTIALAGAIMLLRGR